MSRMTDEQRAGRDVIIRRGRGACEVCGGRGQEISHRRSRRVRDEHTHCPCNTVWSCRTCHQQMHDRPEQARERGLHLSQWVEQPAEIPVRLLGALWHLDCQGGITLAR